MMVLGDLRSPVPLDSSHTFIMVSEGRQFISGIVVTCHPGFSFWAFGILVVSTRFYGFILEGPLSLSVIAVRGVGERIAC